MAVATDASVRVAQEGIESFNAGDWDRFEATLTSDSVYEEPGTQRRLEGRDAILDAVKGWKDAFPDAKGTIRSSFASGERVALEISWEGTQTGPMEGPQGTIPATGKRVQVEAAQVLTISDGKIKENRHFFDLMGMLQQLGVLPQ